MYKKETIEDVLKTRVHELERELEGSKRLMAALITRLGGSVEFSYGELVDMQPKLVTRYDDHITLTTKLVVE